MDPVVVLAIALCVLGLLTSMSPWCAAFNVFQLGGVALPTLAAICFVDVDRELDPPQGGVDEDGADKQAWEERAQSVVAKGKMRAKNTVQSADGQRHQFDRLVRLLGPSIDQEQA